MGESQKIKEILSRNLGIPVEKITDGIALGTVREWDSLKHLGIIMDIEDEFSMNVDPEAIVKMNSYQGILKVISKK